MVDESLEQAHYNKVSIEDLNTSDFINEFVEKLDKQKLYFTQDDINEFHEKYGSTIKTHLKEGNLLPGFEIYNSYKTKAISRLSWVLTELDESPDLFSDQNYTANRDKSAGNHLWKIWNQYGGNSYDLNI